MHKGMKTAKRVLSSFVVAVAFAVLVPAPCRAQQQPQSPEEQRKQTFEYIEKETDRLTTLLDLEYWQVFYVDSTLTSDIFGMQEELKGLSDQKISNSSMYYTVQDKWMQRIYDSYHRFLNEDQWAKYLKSGAAREQKARDKRRAKAE